MDNALTEILRAASKHPNSRVSKLIHTVDEDRSQKNIVLLLIEIADHAEYSTDFNISLKYYLDLFESGGITSELALNEAGLLLVNSSKIYSKRVDYVQSLVERQILTLSSADNEIQQQKLKQQEESAEYPAPVEKPKRGRKRALEVPSDPYEVELVPKKFKKLSDEKRFAIQKPTTKPKLIQRNIEIEQHIHPAGWMHAIIYDLDNEDDVDTKRNYKLFTYHIEHRYNTLVPDINFRLHFKVKDYMDAQEEEMTEDEACNTDRTWPPLSEEYVQKYIKLENYVLQQDFNTTNGNCMSMDDGDNDKRDRREDAPVEKPLNDAVKQIEISVQKLNNSAVNESKNDSGLGHSLLDESYKNDNTLDATQLDVTIANETTLNNTTLESSKNSANLNDTASPENDEILNSTQTQSENDSALGSSLLDSTSNSELNLTADMSGSLNATTLNATVAEVSGNSDLTNCNENLSNIETNREITNCNITTDNLNVTEGPENKESTENGTIETQNHETKTTQNTEITEISKKTEEINTAVSSENTDNLQTAKETGENINTKISQENSKTNDLKNSINTEICNAEQLLKATEARKDSALSDDRHLSISTENLAISMENLAEQINKTTGDVGKCLEIDIVDKMDVDRSQIRIHLPNMDDEGVYLSDLDEHDMRMLSPNIKVANILPGVLRKNVTIHMDDELRRALELRDGIMEHFGQETYHVPVVTEPTKQKLVFNILKLPEKIIRKKLLFKLGPDMDLYIQARSLKRQRYDPKPREYRTTKLLQWFSLKNTDMTDIIITPPNSPGHCSDFCGFTDDEDREDIASCAEFCGFSAEEQAALLLKNINRLSRDSGVGVDVNQLTPDKEPLEIIFEESSAAVENCKKNISFEENKAESTESILKQLSSEIREALLAEITDDTNEKNTETVSENNTEETEKLATENSTQLIENSANNAEETIKLPNENSSALLEPATIAVEETAQIASKSSSESPNMNQGSENILTLTEQVNSQNVSETPENMLTLTEQVNSQNVSETPVNMLTLTEQVISNVSETPENMLTLREQVNTQNVSETPENVQELTTNMETNTENQKVNDDLNKDGQLQNTEEVNKTVAHDLAIKDCDKNNFAQNVILDDHHADNSVVSEDDLILDLNTQGTKTKIQQWHEHLQPILAKSRERHHFDVFKLGTEIIEKVQTTLQSEEESISSSSLTSHPVASFHDIMDNKDKSYVSRYFLSTLLLANQNNVKISVKNKSSEKPSSWSDIQLKLLSTKRHTVAIEDNIGMVNNKNKVEQKVNNKIAKTKEIKPSPMENDKDEDDDDEPLIRLQGSSTKINKMSKAATKRTSDTLDSTIVDKKPKDAHVFTQPNSILIKNVQILPSLPTTTHTSLSSSPSKLRNILDKPCTSRQAKELQSLEVNLNSVRTLQPIEKKSDVKNIQKYFRKIKKLPVLARASIS